MRIDMRRNFEEETEIYFKNKLLAFLIVHNIMQVLRRQKHDKIVEIVRSLTTLSYFVDQVQWISASMNFKFKCGDLF